MARISRQPRGRLWRQVAKVAGVTKGEFLQYFRGASRGVAIFIDEPSRFSRKVMLAELRELWRGFNPPQGFRYVSDEVVAMLTRAGARPEVLATDRAA